MNTRTNKYAAATRLLTGRLRAAQGKAATADQHGLTLQLTTLGVIGIPTVLTVAIWYLAIILST